MFGSEKYSEEDSSVGDTVITSGVNFGETRSRICRNSLLFLYLYKDLQWSKNKSYEYAKRIWEWWAGRKQGRGQWKLGQILGEDEVGVCRALHLEGNVEASPFSMLVLIEKACVGRCPCATRVVRGQLRGVSVLFMCILGIKLSSSSLVASACTCWAISPARKALLWS